MTRLGRQTIGVDPIGVTGDLRRARSHVGTVSSTNKREYTQFRTTTVTADASIESMQTLQPVFPDKEALDVSWAFEPSIIAFATEWLEEDSLIRDEDRDGIGVVLGGSLETEIDVFIQYDITGDGIADRTSEIKPLRKAYDTLSFTDSSLFGEDGFYRVAVRGLRHGDTINQVDLGAVHDNL